MLHKFSDIFKKSMNDPRKKKSWQSMIGISIFTLFVLSSIVVNESVQALNQAAGNYGYYGGSYGYGGSSNSSRATSDQVPSAPTALSSSSVTSTTATVSWTAPTTTTASTAIATGGGSISSYKFHYSTSSLSSCSGGTSSVPTSATTSLTGLSANTTYYVAVCATDNNVNDSAAVTGSFTTTATTGGNAGAAGGSGATGPTFPTATTTATTPTAVATGAAATSSPAAISASVQNSASEFGVTLSTAQVNTASSFVSSGTTAATVKLGSGERLALVRDQMETLGRVDVAALEQLAAGQKPTARNLSKEQAQVSKVLTAFVKLTGHRPNFKIAKEDLAWNTMMYRIRFSRDLNKERAGITKFRAVYGGKTPSSPLDWAAVRAWGYALK